MKYFLTVFSVALFLSVFFTPADDAPLSTFFLWFLSVAFVGFMVKLIWERLDEWDAEDKKG